ncbi:transglycosylase domain-containing protein [Echinicola sp. CAU 1574]|uniref:Transglycosylase domain-containing protein n=1 Tax=Echinicola arenosa TaxID=2774144 RepID=A0ABR9ALS1_9BACT|nr:transglycosylase domain-containing protein [Echinicola arenosa]MBD8489697.1 transglycosylase domain-containing protein [Echinicola arenosa]
MVLFLTSTTVYCIMVVIKARAQTPDIVLQALHSDNIHLSLHDLSKSQLSELLKVQDPNFYAHHGFDISTPGTGITTLSQGLVKQFYFDDFKPGLAKIKQTLIARFAFDPMTPKDTILTLFINYAYMGHIEGRAIHGFQPAAEFYFKKNFADLNEDEYLALIAMIRAPNTFHYLYHRKANDLRVSRIKRYLSEDYIPKDNGDFLYDRE